MLQGEFALKHVLLFVVQKEKEIVCIKLCFNNYCLKGNGNYASQ